MQPYPATVCAIEGVVPVAKTVSKLSSKVSCSSVGGHVWSINSS